MSKRRGLGKGLSELIPAAAPQRADEVVSELAVDLIDPNPFQPRRHFDQDELTELANSIKTQGLLQPVADGRDGDSVQTARGFFAIPGDEGDRGAVLK